MNACPPRRRMQLATLATLAGLAMPWRAARAQPAPRRIAWLQPATEAATVRTRATYTQLFAEAGWVEGRDYIWDIRHADHKPERLLPLATELLASKPALIFAPGQAAMAAMQVDSEVPVLGMGDLVTAGLAKNLHRPGGRATGVSIMFEPLNLKRMELLAELLPRGSSVLVIAETVVRERKEHLAAIEASATRVGLVPRLAFAQDAAGIEAAFQRAMRERMAGVNQLNSPLLWAARQTSFKLSVQHRLPAIYQWADGAAEGGLMAYGPRNLLMTRQLVRMAVRVLGGEKPAQMPIEQPNEIHLALNQKVAAQIGVKFPPSLLARADEVIQ